jgi:hypothetical protein
MGRKRTLATSLQSARFLKESQTTTGTVLLRKPSPQWVEIRHSVEQPDRSEDEAKDPADAHRACWERPRQ